ncbi:MAG: hypothetical protein ABIJ91_01165 [Candidatus Kuenenbacteria bacterium]
MPSRSFSDITQLQWIKSCRKLGMVVETKHGKGSHVLVKHPKTGHKYTIQSNLHKFVNIKIFKKMLEWGFEEEKIWNALN